MLLILILIASLWFWFVWLNTQTKRSYYSLISLCCFRRSIRKVSWRYSLGKHRAMQIGKHYETFTMK